MAYFAAYAPDGRFVVHRLTHERAARALCGFYARLGWFDIRPTNIPGQRLCSRCARILALAGEATR